MLPPWTGTQALLHTWRRCNPLMALALGAVAGVVVCEQCAWRPSWLLAAGAAACLALHRRRLLLPGVVLAFALLHGWRREGTYEHPLRERLLAMPDRPVVVGMRGRLYPWTEGAELDEARAFCEVEEVRWGSGGTFQPMSACVKVALPTGFQLTEPGVYEMEGALALPRQPLNPGQFDPVDYGLRMGWVAVLQTQTARLATPQPWSPKFHLLHWAEASRQWITAALSRGIEEDAEDTAVILAMALGASDAAGEEIEDSFRDSGTLHIFAVSGLHVVMVAGVAAFLLRWLGFGKARAVGLLIVMVFGYAYVTGWRPSAARAALMIAFVLAAPVFNRRAHLQNSLGAAALLLLAYDTHQLFMPGFQLSFAVLWAIVVLAGPMLTALKPWTDMDPFMPQVLASWQQRTGAWCRTTAASLACVSLAAWAGSLPLTIGHFQTVTPVGVFANLLLVPLSGFCITSSCISLCCAAAGFGAGQMFCNLVNVGFSKAMTWLAAWFCAWPLANFTLDLRFEKAPPPVEMRVFHLSGGGSACHLRAGTAHWLLDTGNVRAWRSVVRPFLRHQGVNRLEGLILGHADAAHVGAAVLAVRTHEVTRLHSSVHEPWPLDPSFSSLHELDRTLRRGEVNWSKHSQDAQIALGGQNSIPVTATVLHPMQTDLHDKADDRSLVLLIEIGRLRVLWLDDAGFITEKKLLARRLPVRCDILVRSQHETDWSGLPELLSAAQPQAVISANDSRFIEQMLPERVRNFCAGKGIALFDLEVCGSVGMKFSDSTRAELTAFRNGQKLTVRVR